MYDMSMAIPKKKRQTNHKGTQSNEIWALCLIALGVFVWISLQVPYSTGFIGFWLVDYFFRNLFGASVTFLPIFMALASLSLFFTPKQQTKWALLASLGPFLVVSIYTEFNLNGVPENVSFPLELNGGGLVGIFGAVFLFKSVGQYGTMIGLMGVLCVSAVVLFNVSLRSVLVGIGRLFSEIMMTLARNQKGRKPRSVIDAARNLILTFCFKVKTEKQYSDKDISTTLKALEKLKEKPHIPMPQPTMYTKGLEDDSEEEEEDLEETVIPELVLSKEYDKVYDGFKNYKLPPHKLLEKPKKSKQNTKAVMKEAQDKAAILEETLASFNVDAKVVNITPGPSVTRYELQPGPGVKVSKITNLAQDLALQLAAQDVRIEAPIPGKALVGIEIPNTTVDIVNLKMIIDRVDLMSHEAKLACAMGMTITGEPVIMGLEKMPHILIAGSTGSGKSVCINTIILSILLRARPDQVKFLMIDPKKVELSLYEDIPHLLAPVVTNPHKAAATLKQWALVEMERRYELFASIGVKDIVGYNQFIETHQFAEKQENTERENIEIENTEIEDIENPEEIELPPPLEKIPYIMVIIDELADLMMVASQEVESTICRLAQMARATGIHLVIATQRPSVNVVTGLIKANVPSRISFAVQSQIDSRTILDSSGAEKLLGRGDMLYLPVGKLKPIRIQGVFTPEEEVKRVVEFVKKQGRPTYSQDLLEVEPIKEEKESGSERNSDLDPLFDKAKEIVQSTQYASTSYLQRKLRIGYNRAARIMDELEEHLVISAYDSEKKSRTVLS